MRHLRNALGNTRVTRYVTFQSLAHALRKARVTRYVTPQITDPMGFELALSGLKVKDLPATLLYQHTQAILSNSCSRLSTRVGYNIIF